MDPYSTLWAPMRPYSTLWHPMGSYGTLWHSMAPYSTEPSHWALLVRDNGAMEVRPYSTL